MFRTATAWTKVIGNVPDKPLLTKDELVVKGNTNGGLIIIGSHVKKTTDQLNELKTCDFIKFIEFNHMLVLEPEKLEAELQRIVAEVEGAITKGLAVKRALVLGQVAPGIPVWKTGVESKFPNMAYIIFPGNVSVEGELGYMNEEDGTGEAGTADTYTHVADAKAFAEETGADALPIDIGNSHGIYKGTPKLDFQCLEDIAKAVSIPLVLHGSSGIPKETIQQAIRLGIRKININTEVSTTGIRMAREFLVSHTDANTRFETMTKAAEKDMFAVVKEYVDWFDLK